MYLKCLILRKLFEGVRAAQWFNIKCSLVVLWKKEKHFFWYRKYQPKSVRCHKTESKRMVSFDSCECPVCNVGDYQCYLNH